MSETYLNCGHVSVHIYDSSVHIIIFVKNTENDFEIHYKKENKSSYWTTYDDIEDLGETLESKCTLKNVIEDVIKHSNFRSNHHNAVDSDYEYDEEEVNKIINTIIDYDKKFSTIITSNDKIQYK
jgi:hypothetical protein